MIDVPGAEPAAGAWADAATVTFRVPDPRHRLAGVRLSLQVRIPGDRLDFRRAGPGWELIVERPPVTRMFDPYLTRLLWQLHADDRRSH